MCFQMMDFYLGILKQLIVWLGFHLLYNEVLIGIEIKGIGLFFFNFVQTHL